MAAPTTDNCKKWDEKIAATLRWTALGNGCAGYTQFIQEYCRQDGRDFFNYETRMEARMAWRQLPMDQRVNYIRGAYQTIQKEFDDTAKMISSQSALKKKQILNRQFREAVARRRAIREQRAQQCERTPHLQQQQLQMQAHFQQACGDNNSNNNNTNDDNVNDNVTAASAADTVEAVEQNDNNN